MEPKVEPTWYRAYHSISVQTLMFCYCLDSFLPKNWLEIMIFFLFPYEDCCIKFFLVKIWGWNFGNALYHQKFIPSFPKLFPPTLAGIKRNIYPCLLLPLLSASEIFFSRTILKQWFFVFSSYNRELTFCLKLVLKPNIT